ncbi:hypothetical protein LX36DRAFT_391892 [Colletotrichum falcatum]|nr:hypothetical protein LX36DRAFT_391892 [Colletotrichum falcatum]
MGMRRPLRAPMTGVDGTVASATFGTQSACLNGHTNVLAYAEHSTTTGCKCPRRSAQVADQPALLDVEESNYADDARRPPAIPAISGQLDRGNPRETTTKACAFTECPSARSHTNPHRTLGAGEYGTGQRVGGADARSAGLRIPSNCHPLCPSIVPGPARRGGESDKIGAPLGRHGELHPK